MSSHLVILLYCLLLCFHLAQTQNTTTDVPTTPSPSTPVPTTGSPTTAVPSTPAPTTATPTTPATTPTPTTASPTTASPTTPTPTTASPTTPNPTTAAPTTPSPTTAAPTTQAPSTAAPTTLPPTPAPTTGPPTIPPITLPVSSGVGVSVNPGTTKLSITANTATQTPNTTITLICTAGQGNASTLVLTISPPPTTWHTNIPPPANAIPFYLGKTTTTSGYVAGISVSVNPNTVITNIRMISPTIPDGIWNMITSIGNSVGLFAFDSSDVNTPGFIWLSTASIDTTAKTVWVDVPSYGVSSTLTLLFAWYPSFPQYSVPPLSSDSPISGISTIANLNASYSFQYGLSIKIYSQQGATLTVQSSTTLGGQALQAQQRYGTGYIYFTITLAPQVPEQSMLTFSWDSNLLNSIGAGGARGFRWAYYNADRNIWQDSGDSQPTSHGYITTITTQPLNTNTKWGIFNGASILPVSSITLFVILCSSVALML